MKLESRIFNSLAVFLFAAAATYYIWTDHSPERADWIGTTALVLSGGLCGLCGLYFGFIARRIEPRPEDRDDAEIDEGAWFVLPAEPGDIFAANPGHLWRAVLQRQEGDIAFLATYPEDPGLN